MTSLRDLARELPQDEMRTTRPFDNEFQQVQERILATAVEEGKEQLLGAWLSSSQPCLFGRLAARNGQLQYCVLSAEDLERGDHYVSDKIAAKRLEWTQKGFQGSKSGFILTCIDRRLALAEPGPKLLDFAARLGLLYLGEEMVVDEIYFDEIFLEVPTIQRQALKWQAGVNFFAAAGDGRWWHDHRIPGGVAFSVNSVGHMAKSGQLASAISRFASSLELEVENYLNRPGIETLDQALELAMRTIGQASETQWGRATELLPLPDLAANASIPKCPVALSKTMSTKNPCTYRGYYHTDVTLPAEYFSPDFARAADQRSYDLDFTYLFLRSLENPAFRTMGTGVRIRGAEEVVVSRRRRVAPVQIAVDSSFRLRRALGAEQVD